uniref:nitrate reductase cytochrome c-type subunit n=1 Tax=Sulfurovum sp. TaxID=1969726 RepID=UPI002868075D
GLRKTDLYAEDDTLASETRYRSVSPGEGKTFKRAFQDAPPMIPHDVEGMLPIKTGNNQCVSCHMPEAAKASGAVPLPKSHFTDFRPKHNYDGKMFTQAVDSHKNEVAIKELDKLSMSRFNCTQCHASQGDSPAPKNNFEADFTSADGASKSSWSGYKLMEGIDTSNGL